MSKKCTKKPWLFYIFITIYILISGYFTYIDKGSSNLIFELKGLLHVLYFPILLETVKHLKPNLISSKHLICLYFLYLIFLIIPFLTNTSFEAYSQGKTGNIGWFYATNEISGTLCILMPFAFYFLLKSKNSYLKKLIFAIPLVFAVFTLGTKMTVIIFGLLIIFYLLKYIMKCFKEKKQKQLLLLGISTLLFIFGAIFYIPKTSFYQNIKIHLNFLEVKKLDDIFTERFLDHFVFSSRLSFLKNTHEIYIKAPMHQKILGIGYLEKKENKVTLYKTIEMDYFDIFYRTGIIGFIIFLYPLLSYIKDLLKKFTKKRAYLLSMATAFFIAGFVGHVFVSPAVSIFVIVLLNNIKRKTT